VQLLASSACVITINFKLTIWLWHDSFGILDAAVPFISIVTPTIFTEHIYNFSLQLSDSSDHLEYQ
jgi:hypothetical protein